MSADGTAEVGWTAGGARHTLLVMPHGRVLPGGRLSTPDVSTPASSPKLPSVRVLRRTPDGWLWALQIWHRPGSHRHELHFSRWRGAPTQLALEDSGAQLVGRATFHGRPVHGYSPTPTGKRVRIAAILYGGCRDCLGADRWTRLLGAFPHADGSFRVYLKPAWRGQDYFAILPGPNLGATLAPDAFATT